MSHRLNCVISGERIAIPIELAEDETVRDSLKNGY